MEMLRRLGILSTFMFVLVSCVSTTSVSFLCDNQDLEIYVNEEYVGKGLVTYTAPKHISVAEVCCKKGGVPVYTRSYNLRGLNRRLIDLKVPSSMGFSSESIIHSK